MLTTNRDTSLLTTCLLYVIHKAGKRWCAADEEGYHRPPIRAEFGRIAIYAVKVVHIWHRNTALADNEVAGTSGQHIERFGSQWEGFTPS